MAAETVNMNMTIRIKEPSFDYQDHFSNFWNLVYVGKLT